LRILFSIFNASAAKITVMMDIQYYDGYRDPPHTLAMPVPGEGKIRNSSVAIISI